METRGPSMWRSASILGNCGWFKKSLPNQESGAVDDVDVENNQGFITIMNYDWFTDFSNFGNSANGIWLQFEVKRREELAGNSIPI